MSGIVLTNRLHSQQNTMLELQLTCPNAQLAVPYTDGPYYSRQPIPALLSLTKTKCETPADKRGKTCITEQRKNISWPDGFRSLLLHADGRSEFGTISMNR
ncbi:hypothetical protein GDO78_023310 [Eleutherodactylus coqui]|uniref:Uncharacterized protein n=1 Tax=Eleutherodactylus coqui TaxID=57060 RepID=A0A8J6E718_ELECQ|nr:hypothetical protein GDO78_023310 [Eleutherodactylus coqui]